VSTANRTHLSFTVPRDQIARATDSAARAVGPDNVMVEPAIAKLSVLGVGMRSHTGVATRMFGALADRKINITLINTSEVRINVATDLARGPDALACLREAFQVASEG
jgi:aspartate kinase